MMKYFGCVVALMGLLGGSTAWAETTVGVSIGINQPGVYGRIDIGNYPQPVLVRPQPVIVVPQPVAVPPQPIYLYVPPGHQRHWKKHCHRYNACGQPVYFVKEQWVRERYEQEQRRQREGHRGEGRGDRDEHRDYSRGHGHDNDQRGHDHRR